MMTEFVIFEWSIPLNQNHKTKPYSGVYRHYITFFFLLLQTDLMSKCRKA